jgi:hypothetical protein
MTDESETERKWRTPSIRGNRHARTKGDVTSVMPPHENAVYLHIASSAALLVNQRLAHNDTLLELHASRNGIFKEPAIQGTPADRPTEQRFGVTPFNAGAAWTRQNPSFDWRATALEAIREIQSAQHRKRPRTDAVATELAARESRAINHKDPRSRARENGPGD